MTTNMKIIRINYDFSTGNELSYAEAKAALENPDVISFETHCLSFFNTQNLGCVVIKKNDDMISVSNLLIFNGIHTDKEVRNEHNIYKMLIAGALKFLPKISSPNLKGITDDHLEKCTYEK